jgi:hypothetical protein
MKRISIVLFVVGLAALLGACSSSERDLMAQSPSSPALSMRLTDAELSASKALASNGDCAAALKVARHYSFVLNDLAASIGWLRLAARCPDAEPKAELAYLLLSGELDHSTTEEVEALIAQIRVTNPGLAEDVRKEVRARLGKAGG